MTENSIMNFDIILISQKWKRTGYCKIFFKNISEQECISDPCPVITYNMYTNQCPAFTSLQITPNIGAALSGDVELVW